jgi:hypothetical protein
MQLFHGIPGQARACTPKCVSGRSPGPQKRYPPTPLGAGALRCASTKASVGHPPVSGIRRNISAYANLPAEQVLRQVGSSAGYPFRIHLRVSSWLYVEVPAFAETLRVGKRYSTQAWSSTKGDKKLLRPLGKLVYHFL